MATLVVLLGCIALSSAATVPTGATVEGSFALDEQLDLTLSIVNHDEALWLTILSDDEDIYATGLKTIVLDLYQISQEAGVCGVTTLEKSISNIRDLSITTRASIIDTQKSVREKLRSAKTTAEKKASIEAFSKAKATLQKLFPEAVSSMERIYLEAAQVMGQCAKKK